MEQSVQQLETQTTTTVLKEKIIGQINESQAIDQSKKVLLTFWVDLFFSNPKPQTVLFEERHFKLFEEILNLLRQSTTETNCNSLEDQMKNYVLEKIKNGYQNDNDITILIQLEKERFISTERLITSLSKSLDEKSILGEQFKITKSFYTSILSILIISFLAILIYAGIHLRLHSEDRNIIIVYLLFILASQITSCLIFYLVASKLSLQSLLKAFSKTFSNLTLGITED
jgi:hypothetical protein